MSKVRSFSLSDAQKSTKKKIIFSQQTNVDVNEEERKDEEKPVSNKDDERKEYNLGVLKQIQLIFGNLAASKLQYYVPRGFWKHFK